MWAMIAKAIPKYFATKLLKERIGFILVCALLLVPASLCHMACGHADRAMKEGFVGNQCVDESECGGGECFLDESFTLGSDFGSCSLENCENDEDCPSDANCFFNTSIPGIPYTSFCAKKCNDDDECRMDDGYLCIEESCIPGIM